MATDKSQTVTLQVIHGHKKYDVKLQLLPEEGGDAICVKHLINALYKLTGIPAEAQRLIHKGRLLNEPDEEFSKVGLTSGAKVMLIGKMPSEIDVDAKQMTQMDELKKQMEKQSKILSDITHELDGIHRGYLNKDLRSDAVHRLEKKMAAVCEHLMQLLEKLDQLKFQESNKSARAQRKALVAKAQVLLQRIDGLNHGLNEMQHHI